MKARVLPEYDALSGTAAAIVAERLREEPSTVLLLPTGTTPLGMCRRLVGLHRSGKLSFARATFFNLDEYLGLPPDHPASYHVYMKENFYGLVDADPAWVHVPRGDAPDPEAECRRYEAAVGEAGGIDLCVLGIGRNGHIGFDEPGALSVRAPGWYGSASPPVGSTPRTSRPTGFRHPHSSSLGSVE